MSIDWIPARKISSKARGNRGIIPTSKSPLGFIEYESCIERDFFLVAIHDPNVNIIKHQPISIYYLDEKGAQRKYTPDASVRFNDGTELLLEIKPEEEVRTNRKKYHDRWKAAKAWADGNGMSFNVITDKEIRTPRWLNIWFTLGASKCADNDRYINKLNLLIHPEGEEYNKLCYSLSQALDVEIGKAAQVICYTIYHGLVFVDTFSTQQLSKDTVIRRLVKGKTPSFRPFWQEFGGTQELKSDTSNEDNKNERNLYIKEISPDFKYGTKNDEQIDRREEMVLAWLKQPKKLRTPEWRSEFCNTWEISESNLYRWIIRYNDGGRKALYPKHENAGRKKKFDTITLELIENARLFYLKPGVTLKQGHLKLEMLCKSKGIEPPTPASFNWYVYHNTTAAELAEKKGRRYQKACFTPSLKSFQGGLMPLQVVQMDNSPYDVFTVDEAERKSLTTPYLTAVIDCYTGMITGFLVSYFASSSRTVLEVLVQSILPKTDYTNMYETQHEWPIQGFTVVILVDNGMDYQSKAVRDFCIKYDIIIEFVPLQTPRYKAFIEQWFNVLKNAMKQEAIPGLRPTLKQRIDNPDLKPEREAVLTLQEIETWLHKWVVDEFNFTNHYNDHVLAPYLKLINAKEGRTELVFPIPREPPNSPFRIDELYLSTLEKEDRSLSSKGVIWEYLNYNSTELGEIYKTLGKIDVSIMRDTRDVRRIWVVNPINNKPIRVGLGPGWATTLLETYGDKPVQETAWRRTVKLVSRHAKEKLTPFLLRKLISERERLALLEGTKKQQKNVRKEKEKALEANKNNIDQKLSSRTGDTSREAFPLLEPDASTGEQVADEHDIFKTYKPRGLATSTYPKKNDTVNSDDQSPDD
jgi:hypothetical protein